MQAVKKDTITKLKGQITISRPQGNNCDYVSIKIRDDDASIRFCEARVKYAEFAQLITGLAYVDCELEVDGLQNVGKVREHKKFEFPLPEGTFHTKEQAQRSLVEHIPESWSSSGYFNSQDSFFIKDGKPWARTTIVRWVNKNE